MQTKQLSITEGWHVTNKECLQEMNNKSREEKEEEMSTHFSYSQENC